MTSWIIDYGRGNLRSVCRAVEHCGGDVRLADDPASLKDADRVILPGVGTFGDCMAQLHDLGFVEPILEFAETGRPMLGICVGMQILHTTGEEFGVHQGLGLIPGRVRAIPATGARGQPHKIPHIGWAPLSVPEGRGASCWDHTILSPLAPGAMVYFVHSFSAEPEALANRLADTFYNGRRISAAVINGNIAGLQFHPEKSGPVGLDVIKAFLQI